MWFISFQYLYFLCITCILFYISPFKYRKSILLFASYWLYFKWNEYFLILVIISTVVDYFCAINIERYPQKKKIYLYLSLFVNLGILFSFKYYNFFIDNINSLFQLTNIKQNIPHYNILLPAGISFYTFQTISYTIDVYRGRIPAKRDFTTFSLYVSFFPQIIAGPIERARDLIPQLESKVKFNYSNFSNGFRLILLGVFKKVAIANILAYTQHRVFDTAYENNSFTVAISSFLFAIEIFCDFSGYCDIAIGSARLFGIKLSDNFKNNTLIARNLPELWKKWHITLTKWFRDYIYIPLVRNYNTNRYLAMLIVFLVTGLWHGASWNFAIWGLSQGIIISIYNYKNKRLKNNTNGIFKMLDNIISPIITIGLFSAFSPFFRGKSLEQATKLYKTIFEFDFSYRTDIIGKSTIVALILFFTMSIILKNERFDRYLENKNIKTRWIIYIFMLYTILLFGKITNQQFYYFQF